MSMEIHVLSDRKLNSIADWQRAIDAAGFALQLSSEASFAALAGFLPAQAGTKASGFECYHDDPRELTIGYHDLDFGRPKAFALSFRWGASLVECLAASMAAAAYASATDGVLFDPQDSRLYAPPEALEMARQMERDLPIIEAQLKRSEGRSGGPET
jgi:hypothetical protein